MRLFLENVETEYGDLLLYNQVRWLSAGKCLQRFFEIRREIPDFINQFVSQDTVQLEKEIKSFDFLKELAFLTDITNHLNDLNQKLQGRNKIISDLLGNVNGFQNKLSLFKLSLENHDLTHFPSCHQLIEQIKDNKIDFSEFSIHIQDILNEFDSRFKDFENYTTSIQLFCNPLCADIKIQSSSIQLELCDLQADPYLQTRQERSTKFFKLLSKDRFPNLYDCELRLTSMFGSTYKSGSAFSSMKFIKNQDRNRLTDQSLCHLLRIATTELCVDILALVNIGKRPQTSH